MNDFVRHSILLGLFFIPVVFSIEVRAEVLSWEDCVQEAGRSNPELQAAQQQLRRSHLQVGASRSDFFPRVTGTAGYNAFNTFTFSSTPANTNPNVNIAAGTQHQFEIGMSLDQNLFSGFKTLAGHQKSKSQLEETQADLGSVKSKVSQDLKNAFARLLFFQKQMGVVAQIVKRREENVRFVELRFDVGRENQGSVMRNRALLEQARFDLAQTERGLRVAKRELAKVLGRNYETRFDELNIKGDFKAHFPAERIDFNQRVQEHPDHLRLLAQLKASRSDVRLAKGDLLPSVDASASISRQWSNADPDKNAWAAGVNLNYPFFLGGRDIYEAKAARAEEFRLTNTLHDTDNQIALGLKQALADFRNAVERIRVQEGFLKAAEVRAEIGRAQYANGLLSYQDWDLVENDLINNQRTILESLRDAMIAEATWERAQGKGVLP